MTDFEQNRNLLKSIVKIRYILPRMIPAETPKNENERLSVLKELNLLDTAEEQIFDDVTKLATKICGTPISLISLIDEKRQWFKSPYGIEVRETPRELSFCTHAILHDAPFVVEDTRLDRRFFDNPLVVAKPPAIFYAGAPLTLPGGVKIGTLCVIDHIPRKLTPLEIDLLKALANHVVELILLRSRVEAKDIWMAILSHELRSPVNSILGFSSILQEDEGDLPNKDRTECLQAITRSSNLLLGLADDLVDLYRIQADFLEVDCHRVEVLSIVKEVCADLQPLASKYAKNTVILYPKTELTCKADRRRLKQALLNLTSNAIKYSQQDSQVEIRFETDITKNLVKVHVINQGEGIQPEEMPRLFQQFSRLKHKSKIGAEKIDGIGLGLFLTKKIVEKMNGTLTVSSVPDHETIFTVGMPMASPNLH